MFAIAASFSLDCFARDAEVQTITCLQSSLQASFAIGQHLSPSYVEAKLLCFSITYATQRLGNTQG